MITVLCPVCHKEHTYGVMPWDREKGRMVVPSYCKRRRRKWLKIDIQNRIVIGVYGGLEDG